MVAHGAARWIALLYPGVGAAALWARRTLKFRRRYIHAWKVYFTGSPAAEDSVGIALIILQHNGETVDLGIQIHRGEKF